MMMNFKKNQNNAVCSMDCKNCPNGASQPNPMDDSMFEKSIAMLHNWVMLEAIREDHPKERIVMVILPGAGGELLTEAGSRDIFEDVYDEMEADLVADGELLLHYDIRKNCSNQLFELVKLLQNTRFFLCFQLSVGEFLKSGSQCIRILRLKEHRVLGWNHILVFRNGIIHAVFPRHLFKAFQIRFLNGDTADSLILTD